MYILNVSNMLCIQYRISHFNEIKYKNKDFTCQFVMKSTTNTSTLSMMPLKLFFTTYIYTIYPFAVPLKTEWLSFVCFWQRYWIVIYREYSYCGYVCAQLDDVTILEVAEERNTFTKILLVFFIVFVSVLGVFLFVFFWAASTQFACVAVTMAILLMD